MAESRLLTDQLRDKALLALEDAVQECRYRQPRGSFGVRFALSYLWAFAGQADRAPFDDFWRSYRAPKTPWSFSVANGDLLRIYVLLGVERPLALESEMWRRWARDKPPKEK